MVDRAQVAPRAARKRVVLLGASNLARGMSTVIETARLVWGQPVEIFSALGHGRSYGLTTTFFGRELPGIVQCGLWRALDASPPADTYALVTDIGNDLAYGASIETTLQWVTTCLDRLAAHQSTITLTALPLASLRELSPRRFQFFQSLFFPTRKLVLADLLAQAEELDRRLAAIAAERQIRLISQEKAWFLFDPIHIRTAHWPHAWGAMLGPWRDAPQVELTARSSLRRWLYLRTRAPETRRWWGVEQRCAQPSGKLPDGTTIALY